MHKKWLSRTLAVVTLMLLLGVVSVSAAPSESDVVHVVQRGETLSSIAQHYGVNMWAIARVNGITNPNHIYVGQRLIIPATTSGQTVHVVQPGETLLRIAIRYGVDAWAIARVNGITDLNHIYVGQRLVIPHATPPTPPKPSQPQPSAPATWPGPWLAEYFDNVALTAPAYVTRQDEKINFDWEWGPPAGGMPTNAFSVRWTGSFDFAEGGYRFYARVDDGVRVYVDGERFIDGWRDGGLRTYSADRTLAAGKHTLQVEYYDRIQVARIFFWYQKIAGSSTTTSPSPTATPTPDPAPAPSAAWQAEFFNGQDLQGAPVATRHDASIGFEWGAGSPAPGVWNDHFSARWTTTVRLQTDHYRFCAMSDDGVRIWVGKDLVLDQWHGNNGVSFCNSYWVASGNYEIKVEYYEDGGEALIYVWWEPH
jgi:LysM repeat protein